MKILMICDFYGLNQTYQENMLSKCYRYLGHEVTVVCSTYNNIFDYVNEKKCNNAEEVFTDEFGVKIYRLKYVFNILYRIRKLRNIETILEQERPDVVYSHDISFNFNEIAKYKQKNNCKVILDFHDDYSNSAKGWLSLNILHKIVRKNFLYRYLKYIDKIYPVVPASADFLHQVYDLPYEKMELLPLGCDYQASLEVMQSIAAVALRQKFKINADDFVIFTGGRLEPKKKTELIIEAIKKLNDKDIHLIILGTTTKENSAYEIMLKKCSANLNVHFIGWLNAQQIFEIMTIADVAIYPACQSALWQQSIGMHLPLIVGEIPYQSAKYLNLKDNVVALPSDDITAENISYHIKQLIDSPQQLHRMKQGAKWVAENYLDYKIICMRTLEVNK